MILDSESQRNLLLALVSEHIFSAKGKVLTEVAANRQALEISITQAPIQETKNGTTSTQNIASTQENDKEKAQEA